MEYNHSILEKIRGSIISAFAHYGLSIGSDYRVSSCDVNKPLFTVSTGTKNRGQVNMIKSVLEKFELAIQMKVQDDNNLLVNVSSIYLVKEKELLSEVKEEIKEQPVKNAVEEKPVVEEPVVVVEELNATEADDIPIVIKPPKKEVGLNFIEIKDEHNELIRLLCEGYSTVDAAYELGLTTTRFTFIKNGILNSIGGKNIANLVIYAINKSLHDISKITYSTDELTAKERQLIEAICQGLTDRLLGKKFYRTVESIRKDKNAVLKKIGGKSVVDFIIYGVKNGLLSLEVKEEKYIPVTV